MIGQIARFIVIFTSFICAFEAVGFLIVYYKTVIPRKEELEASGTHTLAPPIWWVFWYHLVSGLLSLTIGVSIIINLQRDLPFNQTTYVFVFLLPALMVIKKQFLFYYLKLLKSQQQ